MDDFQERQRLAKRTHACRKSTQTPRILELHSHEKMRFPFLDYSVGRSTLGSINLARATILSQIFAFPGKIGGPTPNLVGAELTIQLVLVHAEINRLRVQKLNFESRADN